MTDSLTTRRPQRPAAFARGASRSPVEAAAGRVLPEHDTTLAAHVAGMVDDLAVGLSISPMGFLREAAAPEPVGLLEKLLGEDPGGLPPSAIAQLVRLIRTEGDVDRTILQIGFGEKVGAESWRHTLGARERSAVVGMTPVDYLIAESRAGWPDPIGDRLGRMLCGDSRVPPSQDRMRAGIALLRHIAAHAPRRDRPAVLCVLAWLQWATDDRSAATRTLDQSRRIAPHDEMTGVLSAVFRRLPLPRWVKGDSPDENRAARRRRARSGR